MGLTRDIRTLLAALPHSPTHDRLTNYPPSPGNEVNRTGRYPPPLQDHLLQRRDAKHRLH